MLSKTLLQESSHYKQGLSIHKWNLCQKKCFQNNHYQEDNKKNPIKGMNDTPDEQFSRRKKMFEKMRGRDTRTHTDVVNCFWCQVHVFEAKKEKSNFIDITCSVKVCVKGFKKSVDFETLQQRCLYWGQRGKYSYSGDQKCEERKCSNFDF